MPTDLIIASPGIDRVQIRVLTVARTLSASIATLNLIRRPAVTQVVGYQPMQLSVTGSVMVGRASGTPAGITDRVNSMLATPEPVQLTGLVAQVGTLRSWKLDSDWLVFGNSWYAKTVLVVDLQEPWLWDPRPVAGRRAPLVLRAGDEQIALPVPRASANNTSIVSVLDRLEDQAAVKWLGQGSAGLTLSGLGFIDEPRLFEWMQAGAVVTIDSTEWQNGSWQISGMTVTAEDFIDGHASQARYQVVLT